MNKKLLFLISVAPIFAALFQPSHSFAGTRRFTYVYEATTSPPGSIELETYVTWQTSPASNSRFNELDFRHEIEIGITDRLQASIYAADWTWQNDPVEHNNQARYTDSAIELIYNLTHPVKDALGSAIYGEFRVGPEFIELEGKIILQKNFGPLIVAYNAALEAQWEGRGYEERSGEFAESLGASFEISPKFFVGAEVVHELDIPDWSRAANSPVWIGPNASYRPTKNFYVTVTPVVQVTRYRDEPDFQLRTIFGVSF